MKHEKSRIVWFIGMLISILIIVTGIVTELTAITIFGVVALVASYVQAFIFCRCPNCSHSFMTVSGLGKIRLLVEVPKYCPKCGKEIN